MTASETHRSIDRPLNDKAVGGLVLVAIGILLVASYAIAGFGEYLLLGIAIVFGIAFAATRAYGYAIATGITGGMGVGVLLSTQYSDPMDGVAFLAAFAAGFAAAWLLGLLAAPRETNPWPLLPAAILAAVAVTVATGNELILNVVIVIAVVAMIAGGLKLVRDARSEA
jgi:hypothetical protein